jgi:hypothetical protein
VRGEKLFFSRILIDSRVLVPRAQNCRYVLRTVQAFSHFGVSDDEAVDCLMNRYESREIPIRQVPKNFSVELKYNQRCMESIRADYRSRQL